MKQFRKMTQADFRKYIGDLKKKFDAEEIDRAEFEVRRQPIKAEIERRMFSS